MKVAIRGKNIEVTDALRAYIEKRLSKLTRYFDDELNAQAVLSVVEEETIEVVKRKHFVVRPMDVEEAILQMNLIGHDFFMFFNAETESMNVVYRRHDGFYGLIEPELQ